MGTSVQEPFFNTTDETHAEYVCCCYALAMFDENGTILETCDIQMSVNTLST